MTESQAQHDRADVTDDDDDTDDDQPDRLVDEVRARIQAARVRKRALQKQQQQQQARGLGASISSVCIAFLSRVRDDLSPRVLALLCCLVLVLAWRRLGVSL